MKGTKRAPLHKTSTLDRTSFRTASAERALKALSTLEPCANATGQLGFVRQTMPESCKHDKMDFFGERSHPSKVNLAFAAIWVLTVLT